MFNTLNFIVPLNPNDTILKLRNDSNFIQYIIRDPFCTIVQFDKSLDIKQKAESKSIRLDFTTKAEATQGHLILREALAELAANQPTPGGGSEIFSLNFTPTLTDGVTDSQQDFNIPAKTIISLYVNGVLQSPDQYLFMEDSDFFIWLASAEIILETTDTVSLLYTPTEI